MSLADNRAKIQTLLEGINSLATVGGGGGGLPVGVSKLISGSFTPTYDTTDSIEIPHGFGEKPNFSIVAIEDDVSETMIPNAVYWNIEFLKKTKSTQDPMAGYEDLRDYIQTISYYCSDANGDAYVSSAWNGSNIRPGWSEDEYSLNATTVWINPVYDGGTSTIIPFKAGHTYRWICGVIDGIQ